MNRHLLFWLTFGNIITLCLLFFFIIGMSIKESIVFNKEYCLFALPSLIYLLLQVIVNYFELTEKDIEQK